MERKSLTSIFQLQNNSILLLCINRSTLKEPYAIKSIDYGTEQITLYGIPQPLPISNIKGVSFL